MAETIKTLTIEGYRSIRKLDDFQLRPLNVLIGANGAGKSNFVGFFRLLREMIEQRLQIALATVEGGADACLYLGPKITPQLVARFSFGDSGYEFKLAPTPDNRLVFLEETTIFQGKSEVSNSFDSGHFEARLKDHKDDRGFQGFLGIPSYVYAAISSWVVYHFHDTSLSAEVRRPHAINDNEVLRSYAENLAPFLYRIRETHPTVYRQIRDVVRLAAPFFDDFKLRPIPTQADMIQLEWLQRDSDYPFRANQLSDGTLRFICLATALLQPERPATVFFDEPELGLHPYALTLLGSLFKRPSSRFHVSPKQVVISTQSVPLLNEFEPEDVVVVERANGESLFKRLDPADLSEWLQDYTLGELWQKNVIGGTPREDVGPVPGGVPHLK